MRDASLLITQARRATENLEFSDSVGITDAEFIQYFNDAQDEIEAQVSKVNADVFIESAIIQCVAGQEDYDLPRDALLGTKISLVLWTSTGSPNNYFQIPQGRVSEIVSTFRGTPSFFVRIGTAIKLVPAPATSSSQLKIYYQQKLPRIDIRSGKIASVTTGGSTITAMTLDSSFENNIENLLEEGSVTVVGSDGTVKMKNVPITAIDDSTLVVTFGTFTYDSDETVAVGDYLIRGPRSSNVCELPDICERYILAYCQWRILKRDSSNDSQEQQQEMQMMLESIVAAYSEPDYTVDGIPILNLDHMELEGWY